MKKLTVLMLVATLIVGMFAVSASANNICESYGEIPKVDKPITLDGLRDGVYDYGVKMNRMKAAYRVRCGQLMTTTTFMCSLKSETLLYSIFLRILMLNSAPLAENSRLLTVDVLI